MEIETTTKRRSRARSWAKDNEVLYAHYETPGGIDTCEDLLPHRTRGEITRQAHRLELRAQPLELARGITAGAAWPETEKGILRADYPKPGGVALCAARLPNRSEEAIKKKARTMGLKTPQVDAPRQRRFVGPAQWEMLLGVVGELAPEYLNAVPVDAVIERAFARYPAHFGWRAPSTGVLYPDTHRVLSGLHRAGPVARGLARWHCETYLALTDAGRAFLAAAVGAPSTVTLADTRPGNDPFAMLAAVG